MMSFNRIPTYPLWTRFPARNVHSTITCLKSNQLANTFIKMGEKFGHKKAKKPFFAANVGQPESSVSSIIQEKRRRFIRRENMLNKVFMSHITDFMSDGQIAEVLRGKGIEISQVSVSPDFRMLFVLWVAAQGEDDVEIQRLLDSYAYPIRDQLSQLRVVGNIPRIVFVKDKYKSRISDLNNLLNVADYGEDFTPVYPSLFKADHMKLSDISTVENLAMDDLNTMPHMRNDVFGVDYNGIMGVIKQTVQKSKALHRKADVGHPIVLGNKDPNIPTQDVNQKPEPTLTYVEYMRTQKIAKAKLRELKKEMMEEEKELINKIGRMDVEIEEDDCLDEYYEEENKSGN